MAHCRGSQEQFLHVPFEPSRATLHDIPCPDSLTSRVPGQSQPAGHETHLWARCWQQICRCHIASHVWYCRQRGLEGSSSFLERASLLCLGTASDCLKDSGQFTDDVTFTAFLYVVARMVSSFTEGYLRYFKELFWRLLWSLEQLKPAILKLFGFTTPLWSSNWGLQKTFVWLVSFNIYYMRN